MMDVGCEIWAVLRSGRPFDLFLSNVPCAKFTFQGIGGGIVHRELRFVLS